VADPPAAARRAIVLVLDSVGIGEAPDASLYGDQGSNTLANIARVRPFRTPTLQALGLSCIRPLQGLPAPAKPAGAYALLQEKSPGKDSVTGHWELMGVVLERPFPVFPHGFPQDLIDAFSEQIGRGVLGNIAASGVEIINTLGDEHCRTGRPIVYTSADSVFQIAAHEEVVPLDQLYRWCEIAFELAARGLDVGRVIARPFTGRSGAYERAGAHRRDYAQTPPQDTLLDRLTAAGAPTMGVGKIEDLFAGRGLTYAVHTKSDDDVMDQVEAAMAAQPSGLIFANLVDFDTLYGHRNDIDGYAANLERFDARLARLLPRLTEKDLLIITADHGNDPTTSSTDHSREYVPFLGVGPCVRAGANLGVRASFADVGQTLAEYFGVEPLSHGTSFLADLWQRQ